MPVEALYKKILYKLNFSGLKNDIFVCAFFRQFYLILEEEKSFLRPERFNFLEYFFCREPQLAFFIHII